MHSPVLAPTSADLEVGRRRMNVMHLRIRAIENGPVQSAPHS